MLVAQIASERGLSLEGFSFDIHSVSPRFAAGNPRTTEADGAFKALERDSGDHSLRGP
jgi:hypothetical protein